MMQGNRVKGWSKRVVFILALILAVAMAGCAKGKDTNAGGTPKASASNSPAATAKATYPLTIKDATGADVTFDKEPQRIVSITPSETEVLYAVGASSKIVAVDSFSDYPEDTKSKPKLGGMDLNVEALLAQKPDVVFANSSVSKKQLEQLRGLGVKVFGSDPKTIDDVVERVEVYGKILNLAETAKKAADTMKSQKQQVLDAVKGAPNRKVYIEFSPGYTVGSGVFMNDLVTMAGGTNIMAAQQSYLKVDPEAVIKANPDVIIYGQSFVKPDDLKKRPGWENINAVKTNRLVGIEDNLLSRVSPRITQTLIEFGKAIQPEKVK